MYTGTVKFFNESKGFGFIVPDGGGKDVFVHAADLKGTRITANDKVSFNIGDAKEGKTLAIDVQLQRN